MPRDGRSGQLPRDPILDSINEGVFTVDLDWRITSFNRAAEKIVGVDRKQAIGQRCSEVFRASICDNACALKGAFASGKPAVEGPVYIVDGEGYQIPIKISAAVLRNDQGVVVGGVETFQDLRQIEELKKRLQDQHTFADIIGRSSAIKRLFDLLPQIAESESTVLIEGPSGTGKELFARAIHNLSARKDGRFVAINCGALPDTLLESELFGFKAGAFTDAKRDKPGRFARADGGTILLDEIGDVSPAMQVSLLRVLQERVVEPLGAVDPVPVNVRVIAASNQNLQQLVKQGTFRQDLFYRLHVVHLPIPPLAQRREDIPLLIEHFVGKFNRMQGKDVVGLARETLAALMDHDYPGNVRELENIIEQAFVLCRQGLIQPEHLPAHLRNGAESRAFPSNCPLNLEAMEKQLIAEALRIHEGNRSLAAKTLGINPSTLYRKLQSFGIEVPATDGRHKAPGRHRRSR